MEHLEEIRQSVRAICASYDEDYWRQLDKCGGYPTEFVKEITQSGFLGCLIPEEYGGAGLGLIEACAVLEEISKSGGHPGAAHAQMYVMGSVLRHGTQAQKQKYLPAVAKGELRLQSFGVTEPTTGTDTTSLKTSAKRDGERYIINGQKVWISRVQHSDLMVLLARTKPIEERASKTDGLSCFIVDLRGAEERGLVIKPIDAMINHHACELFFDNFEVPAENLLGEEHKGFKVIMDGMNAERILIGAECIGDARYFIDKAKAYASERIVFDRPIGQNQGNMAKMLAADASWKAGDTCLQTHGGFGISREYHIERKLRETRLYQIAPISTNLILSYLSEHVLGMPRSF